MTRTGAAEFFSQAQVSAVHLELREAYAIPEEDEWFTRWRETSWADTDPDSANWRGWTSIVRGMVACGVEVRRVRVVSEPVTDYIRFEHAGTPTLLAAGEQVRWLPRRRAADLLLHALDHWVLDGKFLRLHHFGGNGERDLPSPVVIEDDALARLYAEAFEKIWERAIPHEEYKIR